MSVKSFKFVSPGVFINEIDNSFRSRTANAIGPVVIGRAGHGIAMRPVKVESFSEYIENFGDTVPGNAGGDVYRNGNYQSPMYGTYAAKAFLNANVAPLTFVRLLGQQSPDNDGTADAQAGWRTEKNDVQTVPKDSGTAAGGAYGLFIADGDGPAASNGLFTGSANGFHLGAVVYVQSGSAQLSGTIAGTASYGVQASSTIIKSDSNGNFNLVISGATNGEEKYKINLNDGSADFIRRRLNTNPLLSSDPGTFYATTSYEDYWLGETFEQYLRDKTLVSGQLVGFIAGISSGSAATDGPHQMKGAPSQDAIAGWFIGQDLGNYASFDAANAKKLFRFIGRGHGEWLHKNVKVSIEQIQQSNTTTDEYGTFSVVLRHINDNDTAIQVLERFDGCNLNPSSPNFVARVIGDMYEEWDNTERRLKRYNSYPNNSKYIRVDMSEEVVEGGLNPTLLPFGYFGPPKFADSGNLLMSSGTPAYTFLKIGSELPGYAGSISISSSFSAAASSASFFYPEDALRNKATDGGISDQTKAYFGFRTTREATSTAIDRSVADSHRLPYAALGNSNNVPTDTTAASYNTATSNIAGYSYVFTLDDISGSSASTPIYQYVSGSRQLGTSTTARGTNTYETLLDADINRFTAPFWGGFDGVDIVKPDPFYNAGLSADPEAIDMNLLSVPGLTNDTLTGHMIDVCEERADAMAVIDLSNVYIPPHEAYYADRTSRIPANPKQRTTDLKNRRIDSSYGSTFYPWVQTRDDNGQLVWVPPSVAMMGVLASSERASAVWFAPAGFNRGGLSDGAAGIPVTNVSERLISRDRDTLYEARINPIASFPSTGIVVFGQKTLQARPSALDRINVRRLVIYLKKQISIASSQILFEQNVEATWNKFKGLVEPILSNVQTQFGITGYRLILDSTTTTEDLIDQNVLYAKIMIKPARAIEYIAIDFAILNTGASFDD
jgi:phage tail sheath protein FI